MSFRIGQRVTSHFTGEGTVESEILPREEQTDEKCQIVQFDSGLLGTRPWAIMKLDRVGDEVTEVTEDELTLADRAWRDGEAHGRD
jgi:hypothetical protein